MWFTIMSFTIYLLVAILVAWLCIFADADGDGMINKAAYWTRETLPEQLSALVKTVFGKKIHAYLAGWVDYICNKPNPFLQIMYLNLILGGYALFFLESQPYIPSTYLGEYHTYTAASTVLVTVSAYLWACHADAGTINADNVDRFDCYDYDEMMYVDGKVYKPSGIRKIPRSKFDSTTGKIIARYDHYCAWLAQCVGELNYRFFLLFLVIQSVFLVYGSFLLIAILRHIITDKKLYEQHFVNTRTGTRMPATHTIVMQYMVHKHSMLTTLLILAFVMMFVVIGFLVYHLWLVSKGQTTNESFKWSRVMKDYKRMLQRHQYVQELVAEAEEKIKEDKGDKEAKEKLADIKERYADYLELDEVDLEKPQYAYSHGFISNLWEVIYPRSKRGLSVVAKKGGVKGSTDKTKDDKSKQKEKKRA